MADRFEEMADLLRPSKPSYFIEEATVNDGIVDVVYCMAGDENLPANETPWFEDQIELDKLQEHVESRGLNDFVNDYSNHHGEHVQETFTLDFETYIEDWENLNHAVAEYLRAGGEVII